MLCSSKMTDAMDVRKSQVENLRYGRLESLRYVECQT